MYSIYDPVGLGCVIYILENTRRLKKVLIMFIYFVTLESTTVLRSSYLQMVSFLTITHL